MIKSKPILSDGTIQRNMTSGAGLCTKLKLLSRARNSHVSVLSELQKTTTFELRVAENTLLRFCCRKH